MAGKSLIARPRRSGQQLLAPLLKAYLLAYTSVAGPRVVAVVLALLRRSSTPSASLVKVWRALKQTAAWNRFPAFCAVLVGGSIHFQIPLRIVAENLVQWLRRRHVAVSRASLDLVTKFLAALLAASIGFEILNNKPSQPLKYQTTAESNTKSTAAAADEQSGEPTALAAQDGLSRDAAAKLDSPIPPLSPKAMGASLVSTSSAPLAGRTMDLTLFAVIRALDILIAPLLIKGTSRTSRFITKTSTPLLFALSSAVIMHAWFFTPYRLPQSYNDWISSAAQVDSRLVLALRHARYGKFVYGRDTGIAPLLGSMCRDYGWPEEWGDPAKTIPVPCEMVHMGCGPNCEKHALRRFARAWLFAARMYIPLQLLVLLRRLRNGGDSAKSVVDKLLRALLDGSRSSAFLGSFVALFYYGVCLARTRLGPLIFSNKTVTPQMWDGGLCVLSGCLLCGWSVLFEKVQRRTEILFFVLPRAAAVWFPRRYLKVNQWREQLAFALSTAVILTAIQERPERVRGVFGKVLGSVINTRA
ncbi:integral membrane protein [Neofusicoccum parvum]|nr:integral membrane protein [Neofusicoccum parvum]